MSADKGPGGNPPNPVSVGVRPASETRFTELVSGLGDAVDQLIDGDIDSMVDTEFSEVVVDLLRRGSQLEAVITNLVARIDASKIWTVDRSRTCGSWLARVAHRDRAECSGLVRTGRALRTMPHTEAGFVTGWLSRRHVGLLTKAATKVPEHFPADEAWLASQARELSFEDFSRVINHWIHWAAPDDAEDEALRRYRNRALNLSKGLDGTGLLDVEFEPIGYEIFKNALGRIEVEFWEDDWAEARQRLGDLASKTDLVRSDAQRRYDALIEMAKRSAAMPKDARKPDPLITAHVDHKTLTGRICELSSGTQVTPGEVLPL